jgi:integrase
MQYRFENKQKLLALGKYPEVSLKEARERRDEARKLLSNGIDPSEVKKSQRAAGRERAANSFEIVARTWWAINRASWSSHTAERTLTSLEKDVFPWLGGTPMAEIKPKDVLAVCRRVQSRGAIETAHRVKNYISMAFRFAVGEGVAESDPCRDLRGNLIPAPKARNFASFTDPVKVGELLRAFDAFQGTYSVRAALLLAPLVFVRPGELCRMRWEDVDLERCEWRYVATKTDTPHIVPLSQQAVAILRDLHPLTGHFGYVFPGARDSNRCMSDAAINAALRRLGYDTKTQITGHGFRSMAATMLQEQLDKPKAWIERQLAHSVADVNGTAYDRTQFLKERKAMMQAWADYLDKLQAGADVIPLRGKAA